MTSRGDLGEQLEKTVEKLVSQGRYNSRDEVLREGVRLVGDREARLAELNKALDAGIADADAGRMRPAEDVFADLRARYKAMAPPEK